jgi:amino acid transporter
VRNWRYVALGAALGAAFAVVAGERSAAGVAAGAAIGAFAAAVTVTIWGRRWEESYAREHEGAPAERIAAVESARRSIARAAVLCLLAIGVLLGSRWIVAGEPPPPRSALLLIPPVLLVVPYMQRTREARRLRGE